MVQKQKILKSSDKDDDDKRIRKLGKKCKLETETQTVLQDHRDVEKHKKNFFDSSVNGKQIRRILT